MALETDGEVVASEAVIVQIQDAALTAPSLPGRPTSQPATDHHG